MSSILTINGGSSSVKFALYDAADPGAKIFAGSMERIGSPDAALRVTEMDPARSFARPLAASDHAAAVGALLDWIEGRLGTAADLAAVGHRVVHGGPGYSEPALVTEGMLAQLRQMTPFDPEHLPDEIRLMEAFRGRFPALPQVACFDTAFHRAMPAIAQRLPIPRRYGLKGVRRYGFHGLSYAYLAQELGRMGPAEAVGSRVILAHLGHGASLAALRDGKPLDTSMGFTPAAGLPMGTRAGDLDPGLQLYLQQSEGLDARGFNQMVNFQSGLLGVSETSSDMQTLLGLEAQDPRAAEAVELFCYELKKWVGAYTAVLGGLDTLVFSGGIGENSAAVRERACDGLGYLGVRLNADRNLRNAPLISADASSVRVRVIRTDEEIMIASSVALVLERQTAER
jgi:acetate kinase